MASLQVITGVDDLLRLAPIDRFLALINAGGVPSQFRQEPITFEKEIPSSAGPAALAAVSGPLPAPPPGAAGTSSNGPTPCGAGRERRHGERRRPPCGLRPKSAAMCPGPHAGSVLIATPSSEGPVTFAACMPPATAGMSRRPGQTSIPWNGPRANAPIPERGLAGSPFAPTGRTINRRSALATDRRGATPVTP